MGFLVEFGFLFFCFFLDFWFFGFWVLLFFGFLGFGFWVLGFGFGSGGLWGSGLIRVIAGFGGVAVFGGFEVLARSRAVVWVGVFCGCMFCLRVFLFMFPRLYDFFLLVSS